MCRNRGGARKLGVRMHPAHGIGHTVGSGACSHVVRVQGAACAAARGNREILLALLVAFLLIGAGNRVLEPGRVGGVTGAVSYTHLDVYKRQQIYKEVKIFFFFLRRLLHELG